MKKTIDHLITPRYKVLANYPGSPYQIGEETCLRLSAKHHLNRKVG